MESRTGHSAGGSAEMPPPPDEAATTGRQTDPGPPKGSCRSAVSAMARLRLPSRSLRPGRAKCARSGPSPSATKGNNRRPSVGRRRHHRGGLREPCRIKTLWHKRSALPWPGSEILKHYKTNVHRLAKSLMVDPKMDDGTLIQLLLGR
jgi:hypothetical protein